MKQLKLPIYALAFGLLLTSCQSTEKTETTVKTEVATQSKEATSYKVDTEESFIEWEGAKPAGKHFGKVKLKEGQMSFHESDLEAGDFTIDMTTISVDDLIDEDKKDLEMHLKGTAEGKEDHFFDVKNHPYAKFEITGVEKTNLDINIQGNLTIKEVTKNISFPAHVNFNEDRTELKLSSEDYIVIDRTDWGINFMSKSIMDNVKDKFINDEIKIKFSLKASK